MQSFDNKLLRPAAMWIVATAFSFLQFFLQIANNTMADNLMQAFSITPAQLGLLSSAFFYPFILVQIPVGFLLERFSTKKILSLSAIICSVGTLAFAFCHNFYLAIFFRALSGLGAGFGFLGMLTITRLWFPMRYFSLMVGLSEFIAMLATAIGEKVLVALVALYGWREAIIYVGVMGLIITLLLFLFIEDKIKAETYETAKFSEQLFAVLKMPTCWMAGIFGCGHTLRRQVFC